MSTGLSIRADACPVCDSRAVRRDAVEHGRWLLLAECPRCDHRWTQQIPAPEVARTSVRAAVGLPEVASAA